MKKINNEWSIFRDENSENVDSCVLALPGRFQSGNDFALRHYELGNFKDTVVIGITPEHLEWYPMPNGAYDQSNAIDGIPCAVDTIVNVMHKIEQYYGVPSERIILSGYSAGAVMAIQTLALHKKVAGVVSYSGAILDPDNLPLSETDSPLLLLHNEDDVVFSWEERFLPMEKSLLNKGYNLFTRTFDEGNHQLCFDDYLIGNAFASYILGKYDEKEYFSPYFNFDTRLLRLVVKNLITELESNLGSPSIVY